MPRPKYSYFHIITYSVFIIFLLISCKGRSNPAVDVPILMYHEIDTVAYTQYWVSDEVFAKQMDALKAYGFQTISFAEYINYRKGITTLPKNPIIISFDDGYQNFYTHAVPVLKEKGMTATIFIITSKIGTSDINRQDNSWEIPDESIYHSKHLIWEEIKNCVSMGFEIGSHTVTHPFLPDLSGEEQKREITKSRTDIFTNLNLNVNVFGYPGGRGADNEQIHLYLQQAGYQAAGSSIVGIANTTTSDIWSLPRLMIREENGVMLDTKHPNKFFMRKVDPDFPIPIITIKSFITIMSQDFKISIPKKGFPSQEAQQIKNISPSDNYTITVPLINKGDLSYVNVTLILGNITGDTISRYYSQTLSGNIGNNELKDFNFNLTITSDFIKRKLLGKHYLAIVVRDQYNVLELFSSNWIKAFVIK